MSKTPRVSRSPRPSVAPAPLARVPSSTPVHPDAPAGPALQQLLWVMDRLLDPERGCPWDREQDHRSLKPYLVEESHEVLEAIDSGNDVHIEEELGDVLMQVVFHARLGQDRGAFDFMSVSRGIANKLVTRHPHVFGDATVTDSADVIKNWEAIKKKEKKKDSVLDGVPPALPTLLKAFRLQEKASVIDGDRRTPAQLMKAMEAPMSRFVALATRRGMDDRRREEAFGDLLFELVNLARLAKINAEFSLQGANRRFGEAYRAVEKSAITRGQPLDKVPLEAIYAPARRPAASEVKAKAGSGTSRSSKRPTRPESRRRP